MLILTLNTFIAMAKKKFDPGVFLKKEKTTKPAPQQTPSTKSIPINNIAADIQSLVEQIESSGTDITIGYNNWRDIGFSLVEALGEDGRNFYHRISRFHGKYTHTETDEQYTACLNSKGSGITPRTLFYIAQQHGIIVHSKTSDSKRDSISKVSSVSPKSSISPVEEIEEMEETEDMAEALKQIEMPTFSDNLQGSLPEFLQQVVSKARSPQDADMLILGTLTVISACMPNIYGIYDDREVYPNLFLFVTAQASAGKGRLSLCRLIVQPIHENLNAIYQAKLQEYNQRLSDYAVNHEGEPPQKPPRQVLFIPANSSSTKFYKTLKENEEKGIMFETEGDTLVNAFKSDYGNYSDGFRKAFHHETIAYSRVKDDEYAEIKRPRLSALMSGTPRQIQSLIPDAENGLFSRFIFYCLNVDLEWHDVFANANNAPVDDFFSDLGKKYYDIYCALSVHEPCMFCVTESQKKQFQEMFREFQNDYIKVLGLDFLASVRRLGLVTFRIAMILTVLRTFEYGELPNPLMCEDDDFGNAINITRVLLQHTSRVFQDLPQTASSNPARQSNILKQKFLEALPNQFDRSMYLSVAQRLGIKPKTAEKHIADFKAHNLIIHEAKNQYRKP